MFDFKFDGIWWEILGLFVIVLICFLEYVMICLMIGICFDSIS
jgi:hypothetical protein